MIALVKDLPVKIIDVYYMNLVGAAGWFIRGKIFKEKTYADHDYGAMNLLIPIVSRIERKIRPPIGVSLIMILQKTR